MVMNVERAVEWVLTGETEVLGENLPQCHFAPHKSHMTFPGLEPRPLRWEANDQTPEPWHGLSRQSTCKTRNMLFH
jgi:hypothetical protein